MPVRTAALPGEIIQHDLERAYQLIEEGDLPFMNRINDLTWEIDSISRYERTGLRHRVTLNRHGRLEGAYCTCESTQYSNRACCIHRALVYISFEDWLQTDQGVEWAIDNIVAEPDFSDLLENFSSPSPSPVRYFSEEEIQRILEEEQELYG